MCSFASAIPNHLQDQTTLKKNTTKKRKTNLTLTLFPRHDNAGHAILELRSGPVRAAERRGNEEKGWNKDIKKSRSLATTGRTQLLKARGAGPARLRGFRGSPSRLLSVGPSHLSTAISGRDTICKLVETYQSLTAPKTARLRGKGETECPHIHPFEVY